MPTVNLNDLHLTLASSRTVIAVTAAVVVLAGCKTNPVSGDRQSAGAAYGTSCVAGAALGAIVGAVIDRNKVKSPRERQTDLAKAAAAGCVIGLAATAVGRLMDDRQRAQHEAEMQKEARRRALEQQQYSTAVQRIESQPASTPQQRQARDAELQKARAAYQESLSRPVQVDIGNGGTSTIEVIAPASAPATGQAPAPAASGCTEYSVLTRTAAGQARQYETWCPNSSGQMVRTDVRDTPAG
jgi:hypothetical protein